MGNQYTKPQNSGFFITKMAIINLSLSTTDTNRLMTLCEQNVRFVMAKTLTQTAQIAQAEIKQHIRNTFVLRKPNFEKSIKVRPATKQTLTASVYTMAGFATLQQTGGKRYAKDGRLAVPQYETLQQVKATRKSDVPGSFIMKLKSGGIVIAQRKNTEIEILYHIKNLAYVPKRLDMLEIGESTAKTEIPRLFSHNLQSLK